MTQGSKDLPPELSSSPPDPVVEWIAPDQHEALVADRVAAHKARRRQRRPTRSPVSRRAGVALAAAAGISGAATVGSATGATVVDRLLRGGLTAAVAAAAVTAPSWAVVLLATGAAGLGCTGGPLAAATGVAALVIAVILAWKEEVDRPLLKGACGALAATALMRVPGGHLGLTTAATGGLAALIVLTGLRAAPRRWRRRATLAAAGLVGLGVLAGLLGGVAALKARSSFDRSSAQVATALGAAQGGDAATAAASARAAAADLRQARSSVGAWWARPAWAVPVVGAHLRAADRVASGAGPAVEAAAEAAGALRLDALRPAEGRLDLARLQAAEPELARLTAALARARRGSAEAYSPWLLAPLQERLDSYDTELADVTTTAERALLAVRTLPGLLGGDRPSRWFVAVANPAETRELGGFTGEYVVLVADKGSLRLERAGTVSEIGAFVEGRNLNGAELPARYRSQRPEVFWQNLTGHPDLPTVAAAARVVWDQVAPGSPLDGVAYIDPHGLAALLRLTGPVKAPDPLGTLHADNAAQLLISDQYERFDDVNLQRKDALHDVAEATFAAITSADLPGPGAIGAALGPAMHGGHLLATSFSPDGQELFDAIGASGRFPGPDGGDLASLRTSNLLENKLDAHVHRSIRYRVEVDPSRQRVEAVATIELRNDATADLPDYVAANRKGLPRGTDLMEVAWYSGLALEAAEVDGRPIAMPSVREQGWWIHSAPLEVPAGRTTTVVLRLAGPLDATEPYRVAVAPQAAAHEDAYAVEVVGRGSWTAEPARQPRPGRRDDIVVELSR